MTSHAHHVVIVGGGAAASSALAELQRLQFTGRVTVVGAETDRPYNRTAVNKGLLTGEATPGSIELPAACPDNTHWLLGRRAENLDLTERAVHVSGHGPLPFDGLILATGASPRFFPSTSSAPVHQLTRMGDGLTLRWALDNGRQRVVIVGAGLIGTETAGILAGNGHQVILVDAERRPMERQVGAGVAGWIRERHAFCQVRTAFGCRVVAARQRSGAVEVELDDGSVLLADLLVSALGAEPSLDWLDGTGLDVTDGIATDAELRAIVAAPTSLPRQRALPQPALGGIAAAGDIARWPHPVFGGAPQRVGHWGNALAQGAHAARTVLRDLGGATPADGPVAFGDLPSYSTYVHGTKLHVLGMPQRATETTFVRGDLTSDRFAQVFTDESGVVVAAVSVGGAKPVTALRPVIASRGSLDDAQVPA